MTGVLDIAVLRLVIAGTCALMPDWAPAHAARDISALDELAEPFFDLAGLDGAAQIEASGMMIADAVGASSRDNLDSAATLLLDVAANVRAGSLPAPAAGAAPAEVAESWTAAVTPGNCVASAIAGFVLTTLAMRERPFNPSSLAPKSPSEPPELAIAEPWETGIRPKFPPREPAGTDILAAMSPALRATVVASYVAARRPDWRFASDAVHFLHVARAYGAIGSVSDFAVDSAAPETGTWLKVEEALTAGRLADAAQLLKQWEARCLADMGQVMRLAADTGLALARMRLMRGVIQELNGDYPAAALNHALARRHLARTHVSMKLDLHEAEASARLTWHRMTGNPKSIDLAVAAATEMLEFATSLDAPVLRRAQLLAAECLLERGISTSSTDDLGAAARLSVDVVTSAREDVAGPQLSAADLLLATAARHAARISGRPEPLVTAQSALTNVANEACEAASEATVRGLAAVASALIAAEQALASQDLDAITITERILPQGADELPLNGRGLWPEVAMSRARLMSAMAIRSTAPERLIAVATAIDDILVHHAADLGPVPTALLQYEFAKLAAARALRLDDKALASTALGLRDHAVQTLTQYGHASAASALIEQ